MASIDFSLYNPIFRNLFGIPCRLQLVVPPVTASDVVNFTGIYDAPNIDQPLTFTPQRSLAISSNQITLWVVLKDFPGGAVDQGATIVVDPDGVKGLGPLTFTVFDPREDGLGGAYLILKQR